jgi:CTP synthase
MSASRRKSDSVTTGPHLFDRDRPRAARRDISAHRAGDPARHRRDQGIHHRRPFDEDFVLCEIGGTVGDIESLPFLEAIRQLGNELGRERVMFVHLTLVPWIASAGDLKTKPTQHSAKELLGLGIQPDILLVPAASGPIPDVRAQEDRAVLQFARVAGHSGDRCRHDLSRYQALAIMPRGFDPARSASISGSQRASQTSSGWEAIVGPVRSCRPRARSGSPIVGKYTHLLDSLQHRWAEAMTHGGIAQQRQGQARLDRFRGVRDRGWRRLQQARGGERDPGAGRLRRARLGGQIEAARFARERKVPYFGICFGMQMAVIEAARIWRGYKAPARPECRPVRPPGDRG